MESEEDKCITALGKVVLNFAHLEKMFKMTIAFVSNIGIEDNLLVSARLSFANTVDLFGDFTLRRFKNDKKIIKEINDLLKHARKANEKRNDILHSYWDFIPPIHDKPLLKWKMRKKMQDIYAGELTLYGINEIENVSKLINDVYVHLIRFMRKHFRKDYAYQPLNI